ncbi:C40 family peptidase [Actinocorallia libanotica]|uniref:C40 family peptidase n=1 Tax=Actinocorallia libanotica TaxID=46162 RepID=A0ABN1Q1Q4_9ACTN
MATDEQRANARVIIEVGRQMKMSSRDILIAIMTAMQESGLRNLRYGDRDSQGLFQQRPSQGWGTVAQVTDPIYASTKFFEGLKRVKDRNRMSLTLAAQAVQRSAYPYAYAKHENNARRLINSMGGDGGLPFPLITPRMDLDEVGALAPAPPEPTVEEALTSDPAGLRTATPTLTHTGISATPEPLQMPVQEVAAPEPDLVDPEVMPGMGHDFPALNALAAGGARQKMIDAAMSVLGTPYSWGGGNAQGATLGIKQGAGTVGFDCSGLVQFALNQAGYKVGDMVAAQQMQLGQRSAIDKLQPGDLVASPSGSHIGIYIGNGQMIHAPQTGDVVRIAPVHRGMVGIALSLAGKGPSARASRPSAASAPAVQSTNQAVNSYAGL